LEPTQRNSTPLCGASRGYDYRGRNPPPRLTLVLGIHVDDDVFLRLHQERNAEELFQIVEKNRAYVRPWLPWVDETTSSEDTRRYIREMLLRLADASEYGFDIVYRGELVGAIGLSVERGAREAEVGYWLSEEFQGRGIVSRATRCLVRFSFIDLGLNRVVVNCAVDNTRSRAIPERLGFQFGGNAARAGGGG
jgi:ribosomal-protein-serine acetyltransferase